MKKPCAPRIYVACLASYNSGILHGRWIDCDREVEDIRREIAEILATSTEPIAEEYAIHDYEGFGVLRIDEYEDIDHVAEVARLIGEDREILAHVIEHCGGIDHLDEAKQLMDEAYSGEWDSLDEWAEDFLDETGQLESIPKNLRYYIDFETYAHDCEMSGDVFTIEVDGKVHVFWNH
jgi:antirestriction protein